jgi:ketosteroid isomerase-like protein
MNQPILNERADRVLRLFSRGEAFDAKGFADLFDDEPLYQFGNMPICFTHEAITASVRTFFSMLEALYHDVRFIIEADGILFVAMDVHYWRRDGSHVVLPVFDTCRLRGDRVAELRIYMDPGPLLDPSGRADPTASVFPDGPTDRGASRNLMRRYFAQTDDGRARVAGGHIPKWNSAGPRWDLAMAP